MKKIILLELLLLFLGTTFQGDSSSGWFEQTIPRQYLPVMDLRFLDSLIGFLVLSRTNPDSSFILKTTDGGNNWTETLIENTYLTSMDFFDNNTGYIAGRQTPNGIIMKTTNCGQNWYAISNIINSSILRDVDFVNSDTGWVCSTSITDGGLWRTTDGGISWQKQLGPNYDPSKIFFINSNTGWIIGNSKVNIYKTTNSGLNWNFQANLNSVIITDIFFTTIDTGWIIKSSLGGTQGLMRSTDGGNNWHGLNSPIPPTETRLFFINNKMGWGGSLFYKIYASKDGYNWGIQYSPSNRSDNIHFADSLNGWAGYAGLVHTTDGGGLIVNSNELISEIPTEYELGQNYPNPFNQSSVINYKCSTGGIITIKVFDVRGKEIATLVNERKQPGSYRVVFEAKDIPSGIYFYQLSVDNIRYSVKKMAVIK